MDQKCLRAGDPLPPLQQGSLRLFSMRFCPFAQRARMVLAHKSIPHDTVNVDFSAKPDWYWERNPSGTVPILEKDDHVVYESTASCEWLDDVFPSNRLTPADPYVKARDRMLLEYSGKLAGLIYVKLRKPETMDEGIAEMNKILAHYEKELLSRQGGPFFGGNSPAMIDFFIWPFMERLPVLSRRDDRIGVPKTSYPRLAGWYDAMYETKAVKETMFNHDTHDGYFRTAEAGKTDYDYGLN